MVEEKGRQTADKKEGRKPWTLREFGGKTLWDWLQLLIVPVVLSLITVVFAWQQDIRQDQIENKRAKAERELAKERAQDEALQAYLDQMSNLLLEKNLRTSEEDSEVRTLARARTLTVLGRLDPSRKTAVYQFLVDADLVQSIDERDPIISLNGADLGGANVSDANLRNADLNGAYLKGADLSDVVRHGTMVDGATDEAILTVRQCSEGDASVGPLKERIYEIMPQMPEEIRLGETERAGLLVSPLTVDEVSESDTSCAELADRMNAQLVPFDVGKLVISRQQPNIQELSSNRVTRWVWDITARQTGKLELIIDLRYAISPEGQEFRLVPQSPVYEGAIRVTTEQPSP